MLNPEQEERFENLRRTAERGKEEAEFRESDKGYRDGYSTFIDIFVHLLDEISRIKNA